MTFARHGEETHRKWCSVLKPGKCEGSWVIMHAGLYMAHAQPYGQIGNVL